MNHIRPLFAGIALLSLFTFSAFSQGEGEEVFEYNTGGLEAYMGEGANVGGFLFPSLFVVGTGGVFEPGAGAEDFSTSEHDPANDGGIQAIELDFALQFGENIDGMVAGVGFQGHDHVWEAELEEAYLHFHVNDWLSIGGGQFLNRFGYQADQHLHGWWYVNQNYVNSRMLNEGHLFTQGGEILIRTPENGGLLTLAAGGVRTHSHAHGHGHGEEEEHGHHEEEEHHDEDDHDDHDEHEEHEHDEEHHHLEADEAGFNDHVFSIDYRFHLPFDDSITASTSFATGENGWGEDTHVFGIGATKVWNGHDHGDGYPSFCTGALMFRTEFLTRDVTGYTEDGDMIDFSDQGLSTSIHYGLTDVTTLSLRHDWISDVEIAELDERHRISPALTTHFGPGDRIRARLQYDYLHSDSDAIGSEHAAWLQIQIQWGGAAGSHVGCTH